MARLDVTLPRSVHRHTGPPLLRSRHDLTRLRPRLDMAHRGDRRTPPRAPPAHLSSCACRQLEAVPCQLLPRSISSSLAATAPCCAAAARISPELKPNTVQHGAIGRAGWPAGRRRRRLEPAGSATAAPAGFHLVLARPGRPSGQGGAPPHPAGDRGTVRGDPAPYAGGIRVPAQRGRASY